MSINALAVCLIVAGLGCGMSSHHNNAAGNKGNQGFIGAADWQAVVNRQPPGPAKLIVTGKVQVASAGDTPELTFESLNKSNPPGVNLRLTIKRSKDPSAQVITTKEVRFESKEHPNAGKVTITYPDGKTFEIKEIR